MPGDYLKTAFYLNAVAKPRKILRLALNGFYRMEHVYDALRNARTHYRGRFSILEFGTNEGYALAKMLYAIRYMKMADRVTVHGFDTFEGMPSPRDARDRNLEFDRDEWVEGQIKGGYERLDAHLSERYSNYRLDEYEFNYGSRLTGESRLVHEINHGEFGSDIELVLDRDLSMNTRRIYRFMRLNNPVRYQSAREHELDPGRGLLLQPVEFEAVLQ